MKRICFIFLLVTTTSCATMNCERLIGDEKKTCERRNRAALMNSPAALCPLMHPPPPRSTPPPPMF